MTEPTWAISRNQLVDAIANIEIRNIKTTGPAAGLVVADDLADAILNQIPAVSHRETATAAAIAKAERERIYAELGNDHYVIFTEDRWTVEHSVECKLSGHMHECDYHTAVARIAAEFDPDMAGRWRIDGISEGLPDLTRADPEPAEG